MLHNLSAEQSVNIFYDKIYSVIKMYVPLTRLKNSRFPSWFSPALGRIFKTKEKAWLKWKKYGNASDYESFSIHRKRFKSESAKSFKRHMKSVEDSIPLSIKHFWTYVSNR